MSAEFRPLRTLFKSVGIAVFVAAISFFSGNFFAILFLAIYGTFKHLTPDYSLAYRRGGLPLAAAGFVIAFIVVWVYDLRASDSGASNGS